MDDQLLSPISPVDVVPGLKKEDDGSTPSAAGESGVVKANKGMILRKSVEYIRYVPFPTPSKIFTDVVIFFKVPSTISHSARGKKS